VYVAASNGDETRFHEIMPGVYQTDINQLQPQTGFFYTLKITTSDGKNYQSDTQQIFEPVDIDSLYAKIEQQADADLYHDMTGYQFYLNTAAANQDSTFFLWHLTETYEYTADFNIDYVYNGRIELSNIFDSVYRCWKTNQVSEIFVFNTSGLTQPVVSGMPLQYVSTETRKLMVRYSLLAEQYVISKGAYVYWKNLVEQIDNESSLYFSQPFPVSGNIINIDNPDERVLGYFFGAGKTEKRIFVNRPAGEPFYYNKCTPNTDLRGLGYTSPDQWPIYLTQVSEGELGLAGDFCFDCTIAGGKLNKPDFWIP
jgi:hypothetical protein